METPESVLIGGAAIKLLIDTVIKPMIEETNHKYLPAVALTLGIARSLGTMGDDIASALYRGIIMWTWAIGVNKLTNLAADIKKKDSLELVEAIPSAWFDSPDTRDWLYEALSGSDYVAERPSYINLATGLPVQNQWDENNPDTSMACGSYGTAHCINSNNTLDDWDVFIWGNEYRARFLQFFKTKYEQLGINPIIEGSYKQDQLTLAIEDKYILAYARCVTIDDVLENLARGRAIQTGSKRINYKATKKTLDKVAVIGTWPAHLFAIVGYNESKEVLICMNSRWPNSLDEGFFYVRYEDIGALYTMHALFDWDDQPVVDNAIKNRDKIIESAKKKIAEGKPLSVREKITLRQRGIIL